jgi:hypothetical protein
MSIASLLMLASGSGGGGATGVSLFDTLVGAYNFTPNDAIATYSLLNTGRIQQSRNIEAGVDIGAWITPQTGMSGYEVRFNGGSWLNLATSRSYSVTVDGGFTSGAFASETVFVEIRPTGGAVVASAFIELYAELI